MNCYNCQKIMARQKKQKEKDNQYYMIINIYREYISNENNTDFYYYMKITIR